LLTGDFTNYSKRAAGRQLLVKLRYYAAQNRSVVKNRYGS